LFLDHQRKRIFVKRLAPEFRVISCAAVAAALTVFAQAGGSGGLQPAGSATIMMRGSRLGAGGA